MAWSFSLAACWAPAHSCTRGRWRARPPRPLAPRRPPRTRRHTLRQSSSPPCSRTQASPHRPPPQRRRHCPGLRSIRSADSRVQATRRRPASNQSCQAAGPPSRLLQARQLGRRPGRRWTKAAVLLLPRPRPNLLPLRREHRSRNFRALPPHRPCRRRQSGSGRSRRPLNIPGSPETQRVSNRPAPDSSRVKRLSLCRCQHIAARHRSRTIRRCNGRLECVREEVCL